METPDTLADRLRKAAAAYYDTDTELMTDAEYDAGIETLRREAAPGEYADLLDRVAAGQSAGGDVTHPSLMGSMDKAKDLNAVDDLLVRIGAEVAVEPKLDGLAVRAVYSNGALALVATRGDGRTGEDITEQAKSLDIFPLSASADCEVRGEVYLTDEHFPEANTVRAESGGTPFANQRAAAAGILRKGDRAFAGLLSFAAYDITGAGAEAVAVTMTGELLPDISAPTADPTAVRERISALGDLRAGLGYPIDGAIIKACDPADRKRLGMGSKAPNWALAFKYDAETAQTTVVGIRTTVGRTGRLAIQVEVEPVFVGGTTITYASGHNVAWMLARGIRIGDTVTISRAGDVIPYLHDVDLDKRPTDSRPWQPPATDPAGGEWDKSTLLWRSTSPELTVLPRLTYALSRDALDVELIGPEITAGLVDARLADDVADIFGLTADDLAGLRLESGRVVGAKVAAKIINEIDRARGADFHRVITALGIRGTGRTMSRRLAQAFPTMEALRVATAADLAGVDGVGEKKAALIREGLDECESTGILDRLAAHGVNTGSETTADENAPAPLAGHTVVVTGKVATLSRTEVQERIEALGGKASSSVSKSTTLLVADPDAASSKATKARDLGVRIISPVEFLTF